MRNRLNASSKWIYGLRIGGLACLLTSPALAQDYLLGVDDEITLLDEIVVGRSKRQVKTDTAISHTNVSQQEIDDRQASTIAELIDSVPGVTLVNGHSQHGSGINIRGFGANGTYGTDQKVIIQVDGADVGAEELYRIGTQLFTDPALFKQVDVVRGMAGTFEYGSGAIGGMVRLETKDASDFTGGEPGFKFRQTLQYLSNGNGLNSSSILAWQPTEDFEVLAHYSHASQDTLQDGNGADILGTDHDLPSWALKMRKRFGGGDHLLTFSISDTESQQLGAFYNQFDATSGFAKVDRDMHSQSATLTYQYDPINNDLINTEVILSYADLQIDSSYVPGSSSNQGSATFTSFDQLLYDADHRYETTKLTLKNTAIFDTGFGTGNVGHELRGGIEFAHKKRKDAAFASGGLDDRFAAFLVDDITFGDHLTLTPALRYEAQHIAGNRLISSGPPNVYSYDTYDNSALMGGISGLYRFDNGFSLFGSAAYSENLSILDDLQTPALMSSTEKGRTFELGAAFDQTEVFASGDTLAVKLTGYHTEVWDISSTFGIDDMAQDGLELEANYALENGWYFDLNASAIRAKVTAPGTSNWPFAPADSARLTIGKRLDMVDLSWEIARTATMTRVSQGDPITPSYTVHALRATFRPQQGLLAGSEVRVGIENLLNQSYTPYLAPRTAPGRTVKISLTKTF